MKHFMLLPGNALDVKHHLNFMCCLIRASLKTIRSIFISLTSYSFNIMLVFLNSYPWPETFDTIRLSCGVYSGRILRQVRFSPIRCFEDGFAPHEAKRLLEKTINDPLRLILREGKRAKTGDDYGSKKFCLEWRSDAAAGVGPSSTLR